MTVEPRAAPAWLRAAFDTAWAEVRSYLAATWAVTRHPSAFAVEWFAGKRAAMNPLAMLATGAAIAAATRQLAATVLGLSHPDSLIGAIASALGPYVHYVALAAICHLVLATGRRDRSIHATDTIAMALYAAAGPAALAESLTWVTLSGLALVVPIDQAVGPALGVAFSVFCFVLASTLGGLHRAHLVRMFLAFAIAFPVTGLVFGYLEPPGSYGLHWVLRFDPFELSLGL